MAHRTMTLTDAGVARYRTRMMKAGDQVEMDGPSSKLWERMGWATATAKPKAEPKAEPAKVEATETVTPKPKRKKKAKKAS